MYKRYQMDLGIAMEEQQKTASKRASHVDELIERKQKELKKCHAELEKLIKETEEKKTTFLVRLPVMISDHGSLFREGTASPRTL